jgi:hypothetical protein
MNSSKAIETARIRAKANANLSGLPTAYWVARDGIPRCAAVRTFSAPMQEELERCGESRAWAGNHLQVENPDVVAG